MQINKGGARKVSVINEAVLAALRIKLSDPRQYFTSYKQIQQWQQWQQWLQIEHGITLQYSWVHEIVRYQLGAKLKVVRKSNVKKNVANQEKFKKSRHAAAFCTVAILWAFTESK